MDRVFKITCQDDESVHVGIPVSRGPGTYRLMVTWPYQDEGHIVEIPVSDIASVEAAREGPLKDPPKPIG